LNWRFPAALATLTIATLLPLPLLFNRVSVPFTVELIVVAFPIIAWGILLWPKGGWFNFSPLINPVADKKHHLFFSLLLSVGIALEWSFFLKALFGYIGPPFLLPSAFGIFPDPLSYLSPAQLSLVQPGVIFAGLFAAGYILVGRRQRSIKKAGLKLIYLAILAGFVPLLLYVTSSVASAGILPSFASGVFLIILLIGVPYWLRAKRLASWFLTLEMMAYSIVGLIELTRFETNFVPNGVALAVNAVAFSAGISIAHFDDVCRQEHHIIDSLSALGKLRRIGYLTIPVAILGVLFLSYDLALFGRAQFVGRSLPAVVFAFVSNADVYFPLFFFMLLLLWAFVTVLGNKVSEPVSYGAYIVFFLFGAFFLASQSLPNVWNLGPTGPSVVAGLSLTLFYEPVNAFISDNYVRLPKELSINYWASRSKLLHLRYRPISEIGVGGFARVVKVRDEHSGRELAVKQAIAKIDNQSRPGEDELKRLEDSAIEKISFEHAVLSNCHFPLIVGMVDYFQEGTTTKVTTQTETTFLLNHYLAEEFVDGITLEQLKRQGIRLTEAQIRHYLQRILLAVNYLHQHDILHRDLTPGNVMIDRRTNDIKIIDLGLAKKTYGGSATGFATGGGGMFGGAKTGAVGTQGFFAPELLSALDTDSGIEIDERYDVYSAGAIGFYLATLTDPPNLQKLSRSRFPGMGLQSGIEVALQKYGFSTEFVEIIKRAMSYDKKDRFATAFEFYAALAGLKGDFVITDSGEIYKLDRNEEYTVKYLPSRADKNGRYDFEQNVGKEISSRLITIRMPSKMSGTLGKLSYDPAQGTFKLTPEQGAKYFTSPKQAQAKPVEHSSFFLLRNGVNVFVSHRTVGLIRFLSRNYFPEGVFRYYVIP
jgi:serine/threonine protein kinase